MVQIHFPPSVYNEILIQIFSSLKCYFFSCFFPTNSSIHFIPNNPIHFTPYRISEINTLNVKLPRRGGGVFHGRVNFFENFSTGKKTPNHARSFFYENVDIFKVKFKNRYVGSHRSEAFYKYFLLVIENCSENIGHYNKTQLLFLNSFLYKLTVLPVSRAGFYDDLYVFNSYLEELGKNTIPGGGNNIKGCRFFLHGHQNYDQMLEILRTFGIDDENLRGQYSSRGVYYYNIPFLNFPVENNIFYNYFKRL